MVAPNWSTCLQANLTNICFSIFYLTSAVLSLEEEMDVPSVQFSLPDLSPVEVTDIHYV